HVPLPRAVPPRGAQYGLEDRQTAGLRAARALGLPPALLVVAPLGGVRPCDVGDTHGRHPRLAELVGLLAMFNLFWRLQTVALRCPRSRQYDTGIDAPCVLASLGFRSPFPAQHHEKTH